MSAESSVALTAHEPRSSTDVAAVEAAESWEGIYGVARRLLGGGMEARWMVEQVAGRPWASLRRSDEVLSPGSRLRLACMIRRRLQGEPLQYVLGTWQFRGLDLIVDPRALIPRPETEQVVGAALREIDRLAARDTGGRKVTAVDLGTGSGAVALSLASERTGVQVWATDASSDALEVARANLAGAGGFVRTRVRLVGGDWWGALPEDLRGRIDVVVSNPPYVSSVEMDLLPAEVRDWEPRPALEAGESGTEAIEAILRPAREWLARDGVAVIEMAPHQADRAVDIAVEAGFAEVVVEPDLAGRPRALVARSSG